MESNLLLDQKIGPKTTSEFSLGKHDGDELLLVRILTATPVSQQYPDEQELVPTGDLGHMTR
ncbi:MAG: hypothetical protein JO275_07935 [Verrucomicrobia bacterium]|nr:hypothetical protein [Verrucomicrobiota bacterium]